MIVESIVAAVLPAAIDGLKGVFAKFSGAPRPQNIDEVIKLDSANVERLKALATLDNPYGTPSQWVVDLRASFRYVAAGAIILSGILCQFIAVPDEVRSAALELASIAFSFVFGDRIYLGLKGQK